MGSQMSFYNSRETLVAEMLSAMTQTHELVQLDSADDSLVVTRQVSAADRSLVSVISGGGSGHEPAHVGFVGKGMLTAAVPGEIFASPSVGAVLTAIREVTGPAGCLLIVKNYTGDRLTFGLAAERARQEGFKIRTVLVADDIALPNFTQPRGLAGTILVQKIAGALAARGLQLDEVADQTSSAANSIRTIGFSLGPVQLPGEQVDPERGAELGMGIHNEPGAYPVNSSGARNAVQRVVEKLRLEGDEQRYIILLNDLGGCSVQEGYVLSNELIKQFGAERISRFIGPVRLMTSLGMHGFSVTSIPAQKHVVDAIDQPTDAPAWPGATALTTSSRRVAKGSATDMKSLARSQGNQIEDMITRGCHALISQQEKLDYLDRKTGDGDAGSTFRDGAQAILDSIVDGTIGFADPAAGMRRIADTLEARMGGSSGVLLAILTTTMAKSLGNGANWAEALDAGLEAIMFYGGAQEGDSTMIDALAPACRELTNGKSLQAAARAAELGSTSTASLVARAGRAAYVPEAATLGAKDPGAEAIAVFLSSLRT
jgi:ATP-dependent dihydroxyacetone kinase